MFIVRKLYSSIFGPRQPRIPIVLLGLDAAGKTTILYKLKGLHDEVITTIPTIGFNVEVLDVHSVSLVCWDVGGCDKIRPLWRHYTENCQAVVFVVDATDIERLIDARNELETLFKETNLQECPLLIFANKQDLPRIASKSQIKTALGLEESWAKPIQWHIQESVACSGVGIYEGFTWLNSILSTKIQHPKNKEGILTIPKEVVFDRSPHSATTEAEARDTTAQELAMVREKQREAAISSFQSREDDPEDDFLRRLSVDFTLDIWDHYTHIRIAWIFLTRLGYRDGCLKIDEVIRTFIANSARTNGKSFHRTMTRIWCFMIFTLIHDHRQHIGHPSTVETFKGFIQHAVRNSGRGFELWDKNTFKCFYSNKVIFSLEAREEVVRPDIPLHFDWYERFYNSGEEDRLWLKEVVEDIVNWKR